MEPASDHTVEEAAKSVQQELDDVFGASSQEVGPSRDYAAEALSVLQQLADDMASRIGQNLSPDVAKQVQDNSLVVLLMLAVGFTVVLYGLIKLLFKPVRRSSLLLYGPQGAGKTTLHYALQGTPLPQGSVTSMQATSAAFPIHHAQGVTKSIEVVDIPGHPRMRSLFETYSASAKAVIFVVDAVDFVKQKAAIAAMLYDTMVTLAASGARVPLLLACNKCDLGSRAFSREFIVGQLEKDIIGLRQTRLASLGADTNERDDKLVRAGGRFSLLACTVPFGACSISAIDDDLEAIHSFVLKSL